MLEFFNGKKILVTGHTGFKGSWLCTILKMAGAEIVGYSLAPPEKENLFEIASVAEGMVSIEGDIRNLELLETVFQEYRPEIMIHLAAQPIVRESYKNPVYTYETNVMGTVNLLECVRKNACVKSVLNVTTDKVYENREWEWGYRENEPLDGYDPYSNSKSCSELVTHSFKKSYFDELPLAVSTARAGNVIGGGDDAKDRIIPDCIRAVTNSRKIAIRNPHSIRPFQHVIEPLMAYLSIIQKQSMDKSNQGYYNVGPDEDDCITTGRLADIFCECWGGQAEWVNTHDGGFHEASFLKLDCSRIKKVIGWKPVWNIEKAVEKTVAWAKAHRNAENMQDVMREQIWEYIEDAGHRM